MRTTAIITDAAYRSFVEFRVRRKKGTVKGQTITDQAALRLFYIMVLFPGVFFLTSHFVFHMDLMAAAVIALLWFLSFLLAGLLYPRSIVGIVTKKPSDPDLDQRREYTLEGDWLVIRTADTESRMSLQRAVDLVVTPTVSFLDYEGRQPVLLPFGSASQQPDQVAFLDCLRRQIAEREKV
jgi:hypothetical protein